MSDLVGVEDIGESITTCGVHSMELRGLRTSNCSSVMGNTYERKHCCIHICVILKVTP